MPNLPEDVKEQLQSFARANPSTTLIGQEITFFRCVKAYGDKFFKIRIAYSATTSATELPRVIDRIMVQSCGAELKSGEAPRGPKERALISTFHLSYQDDAKD